MQTLSFEKARIVGVEHKIGRTVSSRIKVVATFNAAIAKAMDVRWVLFDGEQQVKHGFNAVELDYELKVFKFHLEIPRLPTLNLQSELAHAFKVQRKGDGKKKPSRLMLSFKVDHSGSPFELLEWLIKVGGAEGALTLEPLQEELFGQTQPSVVHDDEPAKPAKKAAAKKTAKKVAANGKANGKKPAPAPEPPPETESNDKYADPDAELRGWNFENGSDGAVLELVDKGDHVGYKVLVSICDEEFRWDETGCAPAATQQIAAIQATIEIQKWARKMASDYPADSRRFARVFEWAREIESLVRQETAAAARINANSEAARPVQ